MNALELSNKFAADGYIDINTDIMASDEELASFKLVIEALRFYDMHGPKRSIKLVPHVRLGLLPKST